MNEVKIEVNDTLTPSSCSKLVIKIIKHILYNSQQIPVNYELLSGIMKRRKWHVESRGEENKTVCVSSYKKMVIEQFFNKVLRTYNDLEDTFKNLEMEFLRREGLKEIILMIGSNMLMPKKLFRLEIPSLQECNCNIGNSLQKNLTCVFRDMINSEYLHSYMKDNIDPMNVYLFIKRSCVSETKSDWVFPKDNFRIPNVKQLVIKLQQPENTCICPTSDNFSSKSELSSDQDLNCTSDDYIYWYQQKLSLKGFKDQKVDGISAFNFSNA